jgi:CDP-diacylglycerol---glycerol-3-phosphate 3-phosphatidyltransferase
MGEERVRGQLPETPGSLESAVEPAVEPHWANVPNAFTFLRVLLVPVVLWLLTLDTVTANWWALGVFVFAAITDSFDGWVARRYNGITRWGQLADPLADKLLVLGTLASLALIGQVWWWAVVVILLREAMVTGLRVRLVRRLRLVLPASRWGKLKTVTQIVAISAYLTPPIGDPVSHALLLVAIVATLGSGIAYALGLREAMAAGA